MSGVILVEMDCIMSFTRAMQRRSMDMGIGAKQRDPTVVQIYTSYAVPARKIHH